MCGVCSLVVVVALVDEDDVPAHALEPVGDGLLAAVGEMDIPGRADLAAPLDVAVADGELALQAVLGHAFLIHR